MKTDKTVSVIVPVYNKEDTLERCIRSLLSQTHSDLEVIAVDDGSTDDSINRLLAIRDDRLRIIRKENNGVSSARNAGLQAASGRFVAFVDADDWPEPDYLEKMLEAQKKDDADLVVCSYFNETSTGSSPFRPGLQIRGKKPGEVWEAVYMNVLLNQPWNKLFVRERITFGFDESLSLGEDLLFVLDYLKNCRRLSVLDLPLYHYLNTEDGLHAAKQTPKEFLSLYQAMLESFGPFSPSMTRFLVKHMIRYGALQNLPTKTAYQALKRFMDDHGLSSVLMIRPLYWLLSEVYRRK